MVMMFKWLFSSFIGSGSSGMIYALIGVVLLSAAMGTYGYLRIQNLELTQKIILSENQELRNTVTDQQETITKRLEDLKSIKIEFEKQIEAERKVRSDIEEKMRIFSEGSDGNKRDFSDLASKKSGLVENAINKGTEKVLRCLEALTNGKEVTDINCSNLSNDNL